MTQHILQSCCRHHYNLNRVSTSIDTGSVTNMNAMSREFEVTALKKKGSLKGNKTIIRLLTASYRIQLKQEVLRKTNRLLSLIRHGPH
jgi:hypothetical protein